MIRFRACFFMKVAELSVSMSTVQACVIVALDPPNTDGRVVCHLRYSVSLPSPEQLNSTRLSVRSPFVIYGGSEEWAAGRISRSGCQQWVRRRVYDRARPALSKNDPVSWSYYNYYNYYYCQSFVFSRPPEIHHRMQTAFVPSLVKKRSMSATLGYVRSLVSVAHSSRC